MKKSIILIFSIITSSIYSQKTKSENLSFTKFTTKCFNAWELVSNEVYKINTLKPTDFLLFDDKYLYTTSTISGKDGTIIKGPNLLGQKNVWRKKEHNGKLILPDGQERKVEIMAFTYSLSGQKAKSFFVMPILDFWISHKVDDHGIGLDRLTTVVFVHEFCHSQQFEDGYNGMENGAFDKYFTAHGNEVFMDDIMQDIYEKDSVYTKEYEKELNLFTIAFQAKTKTEMKILAKDAITALEERQKRILLEDKRDLAEIDNYWLTIEGVAQFSSFQYLINPKGGKLSTEKGLKSLKTASWSQEEGFAIVYLFSKLSEPKDWSQKMFRSKTINIINLLKKEIEK